MSRATRTGQGSVSFGQSYGLARPVAYTPVVTWAGNTITTQSGFYLKLPGMLLVWVSFVETVGTASAALTITIPTGYTAVTQTGSLNTYVGSVSPNTVTAPAIGLVIVAGGTTQVIPQISSGLATGVVATWFGYVSIPTLT